MRKSNRLSLNILALSVATMLFLPSVASCKTIDPANSGVYIGTSYGVGIANKIGSHYKIDEGTYLPSEKPKNSRIFGLALGYKFNDNIRAELALNRFHKFKFKPYLSATDKDNKTAHFYFDQKISASALFANLYFDVNTFEKFTPYISLGIGYSRNKSGDLNLTTKQDGEGDERGITNKSDSYNKFAYNVGAGIAYKLNDKVFLEVVNYKYYNLGKVITKPDDDNDRMIAKLSVHSINTGIRFQF